MAICTVGYTKTVLRKMLIIIVLAGVASGGLAWWQAGRNTPQATAKRFTTQLAEGRTDAAYDRLTASLTHGRETYWRDYLKQFASSKAEPTFGKQEAVVDSFNTYTDSEEPQRFSYTMHLAGQDYQLIMLLIKQDGAWKIDELYGSAIK